MENQNKVYVITHSDASYPFDTLVEVFDDQDAASNYALEQMMNVIDELHEQEEYNGEIIEQLDGSDFEDGNPVIRLVDEDGEELQWYRINTKVLMS